MTVTLSFTQRMKIVSVLAQFKGNVGDIRKVSAAIDALDPSEDIKKAHGLRPNPKQEGSILWDGGLDEQEVDIEQEPATFTAHLLENWNGFGPADIAWLDDALKKLKP